MNHPIIHIQVSKRIQAATSSFLLNLNEKIPSRKFIILTGPSGSGKSTLLKLIAGLDHPDSGFIHFEQSIWTDLNNHQILPIRKRKIGMVFQDYALFPNMTVKEHLLFGPRLKKLNPYLEEILEILELEDFLNRYPANLSGGQQQRVALGRALSNQPNMLLLDEALSALDTVLRKKISSFLVEFQKKYEVSIILVSHQIDEILEIADWVCLLENGKLVQSGPPHLIPLHKINTLASKATLLKRHSRDDGSEHLTILVEGKSYHLEVPSKDLK